MLIEKVLEAARPSLVDKEVKDLVIGLSLISCQLTSGEVGVSYVLRDNLPAGCSIFAKAREVVGMQATEAAALALVGEDDVLRSIGMSVLVAASQSLEIPNDDKKGMPFHVEFSKDDTVGMVGLIRPVAKMLKERVKEVIVFDRGLEGKVDHPMLRPMSEQKSLLPQCDVVLLSGTTMINGSLDALLEICGSAREIVLLGPSTPMYAQGFEDTGVTRVSGSWWTRDRKDEIFKSVSMGCGIPNLSPYMIKKTAFVKNGK
jgi:hypothetical protein